MPFFSFKSKRTDLKYRPSDAPPEWTPAPEHTHTLGLYSEATENDYESAEQFCNTYPVEGAKLLPSYVVDRINSEGCKAWKLQWPATRFVGEIKDSGEKGGDSTILVKTKKECKDVCILSDLPLMAGRYDIQGKLGVYYEVKIHKMKGIIAIGESTVRYLCTPPTHFGHRYCMQTVPRMEVSWVEPTECRPTPRRYAQILRRSKRWSRLYP